MAKGGYIGVEKTTYLNSLGDVAVGSTVKINENGSPVEFFVATHDYESELNGSGRTLLVRKTLPTEKVAWSNAANQYVTGTPLNVWLNNTYKTRLDSAVQDAISTTRIKSCSGSGSSEITVRSFSIFALSVTEFGLSGGDVPVEGTKLPIASTLLSLNDVDPYSGSSLQEWTRTPEKNGTQYAFYEYSGSVYQQTVPTYYNVRPCFTLPASLGVGDDNLITGVQAESVTQPVARKIKKNYVGVDSVARKIKKAYIGIGGVARPCWSGGELAYYGTITPLSVARYNLAATSNKKYALFGGGEYSGMFTGMVNAYDSNLTLTQPTAIAKSCLLSATSVGDYALFGGGYNGSDAISTVCAYNSSLVKSEASQLYIARRQLAATSVGNYALFGGGKASSVVGTLDVYDSSLARTNPTSLSSGRQLLAATTVGNYALFGGGTGSSGYSNVVDAIDTALTRKTAPTLSVVGYELAATSVGNYALFGGGQYGNRRENVDAYDASLTKITATSLSDGRPQLAATSVGNYALFGGGYLGGGCSIVEAYDASLTRTLPTELSAGRSQLAATSVGDYALFGGGLGTNGTYYATVDAYTVA